MKTLNIRNKLTLFIVLIAACSGSVLVWAQKTEHPAMQLQMDSAAIDRDEAVRVSYSSIVKKAAPSVVYVFSTKRVRVSQNPLFGDPLWRRFFGIPDQGGGPQLPRESEQHSLGSGVIVSANGYIVTNNHVIDGADEVKVAVGEPRREYAAQIIGRDPKADVAVLKIDASGLPAVTLGDSDKLEVGDTVLAIGNPFGIGLTVTHGIVSALSRSGLGIEQYEDFIQTDAPINPGNSGGALVDTKGRVIGINTAILSGSGGSNGVGFAIPINLVHSLADELVRTGKIERGYLGVSTQELTSDLAKEFGVDHGAIVTEVARGTPAEKAGFKTGDVITKINGTEIRDPERLALSVSRFAPGTPITVTVLRDGKPRDLKATLASLPEQSLASGGGSPGTGSDEGVLNGVGVGDLNPQLRSQYRVPGDVMGAIITQVDPDSASARVGLRPGDIIVSLDRRPVTNADEAVKLSSEIKGPKVLVRLWREGRYLYVVVDEGQ
ncbi:MAG TPA: DegQ family serine endoprotease [Steroidobacteraceae bacterium]|jgi:serine protease Do|nr:DegQ family serine endoprotease [Steroidobacteraceae bacterium]